MKYLFCIIFVSGALFGQSDNSWRGITPLVTTREEVELKIGKPIDWSTEKYSAAYTVEGGRASILYSNGCRVPGSHGWNIPETTVIRISFSPNSAVPLQELKLNLRRFQLHPDPDSINLVSLANDEDGVVLIVDTPSNLVERFIYFPRLKDSNRKCKR